MKIRRRAYVLIWLALVVLIISASMLLVISLGNYLNPNLKTIISFAVWTITIVSALIIFQYASKWKLLEDQDDKSGTEPDIKRKEKKSIEKKELEQLDIQGIAKKLVRRISPRDKPEKWGKQLLSMLVSEIEIMSGVFYSKNNKNIFESVATFAFPHAKEPYSFKEGEGLTGQAVKNRQLIVYRTIPDEYQAVFSGLGSSKPSYLAIVPIIVDDKPVAIFEIAGFRYANENLEQLFKIIAREISEKIKEDAENNSKDSNQGDSGEKIDA